MSTKSETKISEPRSYERIILIHEGPLTILKFNHPEAMNAIGVHMLEDLNHAIQEIVARGSETRCLLITGEGRGFCAGANLADQDRAKDDNRSSGDALRESYHPLLCALRDLPMPVVTAVNGAAAGIGMSFALMGDIVCAGRSAFFFQAFARIGLVPDGGSTFILPRLIGWGRALELSLLAERLPAEKASDWGLVNFLFDDEGLMEGACKIAGRLAKGPKSLGLIRHAYWQTWGNTYEAQLELEASLQEIASNTSDAGEGVQAFLEKREPNFTGH